MVDSGTSIPGSRGIAFVTTNGTRQRLTGTLSKRRRGYLLTCDNGDVWAVDFSDGVVPFVGGRAVVEGVQIGLDRLLADWAGPSANGSEP